MSTLVRIKNLSRRRLRFGGQGGAAVVALPAATPTGTGATAQIDVDDPQTRRDLYRNFGSWATVDDVLVAKVPLAVAVFNTNGAAFAWANPEGQAIFVHRAVLDITTQGSATSTVDVGATSTALGAADTTTLFNAQATSATGTFQSSNVVKLATADFVSGTYKTATPTGLVANIYLFYTLVTP